MSITRTFRRGVLAAAFALAGAGAAAEAAAQSSSGEDRYLEAVADYFSVTPQEVSILNEWGLAAEEVPVVLFVARRAGVPPDVVVALREGGMSWTEVAGRYRMGAGAFHVDLGRGSSGSLSGAVNQFESRPEREWPAIRLADAEIVSLVNVRVLSVSLAVSPSDVVQARDRTGGYVEGYRDLNRGRP